LTKAENTSGYLLGVDVGNTKTHAIISDLSGKVIGFGEAGCGNYEVVGLDGFSNSMRKATDEAIKMSGINKQEIISMGFGIAGYDWPSEKNLMIEGISRLGFHAPFKFVNDVVIGILAGTSEGWGIAVDAGTGNNVRGLNKKGEVGRITGNSIYCGEYGGASEMVQRAVIAVTYAWSKRGPKTKLTQLFMDFAQVENEDNLIEGLALQKIRPGPLLAKDIFKLASLGDEVAVDIIQWTAKELGSNVNAVIRQLQLQEEVFEVVLIGSLLKAGEAYIQPLRETIHQFAPHANLIQLSVLPVFGSVILAAKNIGVTNNSLRHALINNDHLIFSNTD